MNESHKNVTLTPQVKRYLTPNHKAFVLLMFARGFSAAEIARLISDPEAAQKYNFMPRSVHFTNIYNLTKKFDPEEVRAVRLRYLADMTDIRLASKKERIHELSKIALSISPFITATDRINALKAIKAEIGEDIDKLSEALKQSGTTVVNSVVNVPPTDLSTLPESEAHGVRNNALSVYANATAKRF